MADSITKCNADEWLHKYLTRGIECHERLGGILPFYHRKPTGEQAHRILILCSAPVD